MLSYIASHIDQAIVFEEFDFHCVYSFACLGQRHFTLRSNSSLLSWSRGSLYTVVIFHPFGAFVWISVKLFCNVLVVSAVMLQPLYLQESVIGNGIGTI